MYTFFVQHEWRYFVVGGGQMRSILPYKTIFNKSLNMKDLSKFTLFIIKYKRNIRTKYAQTTPWLMGYKKKQRK